MKSYVLMASIAVAASIISAAPEADACGGCFTQAAPATQNASVVTDHRMVFSIAKDQSTLYDQIRYSGSPESFAWVLPFAGDIEVGVSSDTVFSVLVGNTSVVVQAPPLQCPPPPSCGFGSSGTGGFLGGGSSGNLSGGVDILKEEVVGPYETKQIKATDPDSLNKWLADHNYEIPESVKPVIAKYQSEKFNFLAVKLVPGKAVQAMRPIRVTTQGANVALPLRMVAAGTGATVGITLWVVAEGRYQLSNFNYFFVEPQELTWDFATQSSDYAKLRTEKTAAGKGRVWEIESSVNIYDEQLKASVRGAVNDYDAETSDAGPTRTAEEAREHDLEVLLNGGSWITRFRADLSRDALTEDLLLQAGQQVELSRLRAVTKSVNAPQCPSYPPCQSSGYTSSSGDGGFNEVTVGGSNDEGCQTTGGSSSGTWLGSGIAAVLFALALRRSKSKGTK